MSNNFIENIVIGYIDNLGLAFKTTLIFKLHFIQRNKVTVLYKIINNMW